MKKIVINTCFGGFGLSEKAYEKLIEWGIPVRKYIEEKRGEDGLFVREPSNEGEVIFDRDLSENSKINDAMRRLNGRYWETWIREDCRDHPLIVRVVEELGEQANSRFAKLKVVEIPDHVKWHIQEYDGLEHIAEDHEKWS